MTNNDIRDEIVSTTVPFAEPPWSEGAKMAIVRAANDVLAKHSPSRKATAIFEPPNVIRWVFNPPFEDVRDFETVVGRDVEVT